MGREIKRFIVGDVIPNAAELLAIREEEKERKVEVDWGFYPYRIEKYKEVAFYFAIS